MLQVQRRVFLSFWIASAAPRSPPAPLHVYQHVFARPQSVNRYQAVYAGINYLILGDRLKLMTGAEYSEMHDSAQDDNEFDGWTYAIG